MLCMFWPVGLFLLIKRTNIDKKTALSVSKILNIFAICSFVFAGIGFFAFAVSGFDGFSDGVVGILFFLIAGLVMHRIAKNLKKDAEKVRTYLQIIVNSNETYLDNIAGAVNLPYDTVKRDIKKLIDKGYLKDAYINEGERKVVLPQKKQANAPKKAPAAATYVEVPVQEKQAQPRVITCSCCGANNTIIGDVGECEYCGSPLS